MKSNLDSYNFYHGCYNSFVLCDYGDDINYSEAAINYSEFYDLDGLIAYKKSDEDGIDFEMVFYNKDGSRGLMCGNGIRCLVKYAYDMGYVKEHQLLHVKTLAGIREAMITSLTPFLVKANLGKADYNYKKLAIDENLIEVKNDEVFDTKIKVDNKNYNMSCVFVSTHHAVILVKDEVELNYIIDNGIGEKFKDAKIFKEGINANFCYIIDRKNIKVRTCERGVGWTLACGTGAASSFAVLNRMGKVKDEVTVHFYDGSIKVSKNELDEIIIEGSAEVLTY